MRIDLKRRLGLAIGALMLLTADIGTEHGGGPQHGTSRGFQVVDARRQHGLHPCGQDLVRQRPDRRAISL